MKSIFVIMLLLLSGCAVVPKKDIKSTLLKSHFDTISANLPVQNEAFTFNKINVEGDDTLHLTIQNNTKTESDDSLQFIKKFSKALCSNFESNQFINAGGNYRITVQNHETSQTSFLNSQTCHDI